MKSKELYYQLKRNIVIIIKISVGNTVKLLKLIFWEQLSHTINIFALLVAFVALIITYKSFNNANKQFEENNKQFESNTKHSDSIFQIQLLNEKANNDSIILQLQDVRKLTGKQISITDSQLVLTSNMLEDQIGARSVMLQMELDKLNH